MKDKIYLYSDISSEEFIKNLLEDFEVLNLTNDFFEDVNFKNNNVLFVIKNEIKKTINKSFFINNNVTVFCSNKEIIQEEKKYGQSNFLYGPIRIKKFFDTIRMCFLSKTIFYKDLKIVGEKIFNLELKLFCTLTYLEKEILTKLIEKKEINRDYFLEEILKIKKNIETKTIESHLTRIRKKLLSIKSKITITSKEDKFYLEV